MIYIYTTYIQLSCLNFVLNCLRPQTYLPPTVQSSCSTSLDKALIVITPHCTAQILSRDSVTVTVDAVVYFNVVAAELALCSVDDYRYQDYRTIKY